MRFSPVSTQHPQGRDRTINLPPPVYRSASLSPFSGDIGLGREEKIRCLDGEHGAQSQPSWRADEDVIFGVGMKNLDHSCLKSRAITFEAENAAQVILAHGGVGQCV